MKRQHHHAIPRRLLHFVAGSSNIPHPSKKKSGGEDAHFITKYTIGVADGVGSWARQGIDSGAYSKQLMSYAQEYADSENGEKLRPPKEIISGAYAATKARGSCTACLVQIHGSRIRGFNLGDSGYLLVRDMQKIFQSKSQSHFFNCPFQLGHESKDRPKHAEIVSLEAQENDLIIAGTDGVFDNLYDTDLLQLVRDQLPVTQEEIENLAQSIAQKAHKIAKSPTKVTPFTVSAYQAGYRALGGKMDDITVVVARVA